MGQGVERKERGAGQGGQSIWEVVKAGEDQGCKGREQGSLKGKAAECTRVNVAARGNGKDRAGTRGAGVAEGEMQRDEQAGRRD